jgi:hypothetical protein
MGGVDGVAITEKGDFTERTGLPQLLSKDFDSLADLLQTHAGIEQSFDHL